MNRGAVLRAITNQDLKSLVAKALREGWEVGEMNGTTHLYLVWPATKDRLSIGTTVSDRNAYKNIGRRMEQISGLCLLPKSKTGRSSHKSTKNGYNTTYRPETQDRLSKRLDELLTEYAELVLEFKVIAAPGDTPSSEINRAMIIIRRLAAIEDFLNELRYPVPKFEPTLHFLDN